MEIKKRERLLAILAVACFGILLADKLVLTPLAALWQSRATRIEELAQSLDEADLLLQREQSIRKRCKEMKRRALPTEVSLAEDRVLKSVERWSQSSGLGLTSMKPRWDRSEEDFAELEFAAFAAGGIHTIAQFLYELEKDPLAVKVDRIDMNARDDTGDELSLSLRFSVLALEGAIAAGSGKLEKSMNSSTQEFEDFQLVSERNIFDPNRDAAVRQEEPSKEPVAEDVPATESITLTGVLLDSATAVAFFEGPPIQESNAFHLGDKVAELRVASITTAGVNLRQNEETLELPVGWSLERNGEDTWQLSGESTRLDSDSWTNEDPGSSSSEESDQDNSEDPATNEILKRMLERRSKELE